MQSSIWKIISVNNRFRCPYLDLVWFVFNGLKYFALNKFSGMECQRGNLFERSELFPSNGMELNL
jgi:hypothetical protein